jgi:hypothetical protein
MYHEEADIIDDIVSHTNANLDMSLQPIPDTQDETKFKFAGGWFTLISNDLLKIVGIPTALGHYGLEDTFIAHSATFLSGNPKNGVAPKQFILNNVVVGENYKHRCNSHLQHFVVSKNRKKEFHSIAQQNFYPELVKFTKKHNV